MIYSQSFKETPKTLKNGPKKGLFGKILLSGHILAKLICIGDFELIQKPWKAIIAILIRFIHYIFWYKLILESVLLAFFDLLSNKFLRVISTSIWLTSENIGKATIWDPDLSTAEVVGFSIFRGDCTGLDWGSVGTASGLSQSESGHFTTGGNIWQVFRLLLLVTQNQNCFETNWLMGANNNTNAEIVLANDLKIRLVLDPRYSYKVKTANKGLPEILRNGSNKRLFGENSVENVTF